MLTQESLVSTSPTFAFKGGMFTLTTIQLFRFDLPLFNKELEIKIKLAPKFFNHTPVLLDLRQLPNDTNVDMGALIQCLREKLLIPFGVRGATPEQQDAAILAGLAVFADPKNDIEKKITPKEALPYSKEPAEEANGESNPSSSTTTPLFSTRVVRQPVRSGQQIYAQGGDLLVMAPVSHGAELLADGHIYVFGPLRGRALAGINGYRDAMIFCQSLEAELVACAGQYKLSEDLKTERWGQPARIELQDRRLKIHPLY